MVAWDEVISLRQTRGGSDDFNQELDSDAEVKKFCELNYDIDMPMSETLSVMGQQAHPFFQSS